MLYLGAESDIHPSLGLGGDVVDKLASCLLDHYNSRYYIVTDNFFTSVKLLKHFKELNVLATSTIRAIRMKRASLPDITQLEKKPRRIHKVVVDFNNDIAVVRWKNIKAVTAA